MTAWAFRARSKPPRRRNQRFKRDVMANWKMFFRNLFILFVSLATVYVGLICFPQPLFAYKTSFANLTLYCDDPIPPQADAVLQDTQRRLDKCPLYAGHPRENLFLCNHAWRYKLLTNTHSNAGGNSYGFAPQNVFLRKADLSRNVLFRKDGVTPSGPDRPLSYFIAHEVTHGLTARFLGLAYWRIPAWKNEGYADYVGKGGDFDFQKNLALFKKGDPSLDPHASGLYLRYQLMVAELLDRQHWTVDQLLHTDIDGKKLEDGLLAR